MEARISRAEFVRISVVFSFNEARTPQELKKPPSYVLSYPTHTPPPFFLHASRAATAYVVVRVKYILHTKTYFVLC